MKVSPVSGVEVPVDADHASERDRGVEPATLAEGLLGIGRTIAFGGLLPVGDHPLEVAHGVDPSGVDQLTLRASERLGVGPAGGGERAGRRERYVT